VSRISKGKGEVIPVLNQESCHEGISCT